MPKSLAKFRNEAFIRQQGRCFYCNFPMWLDSPATYATKHKLTKGEVNRFQCTAEHLHARQDGGQNNQANIVAACLFCNQKRHARPTPLPVEPYKQLVTKRLKNRRWHPAQYRCLLGPSGKICT